MSLFQSLFLFATGLLCGFINALAGGGSFFSFPALMSVGLSAVPANATSTIILLPGQISSFMIYAKGLSKVPRKMALALAAASLVGGTIGAWLLTRTDSKSFLMIVPWLILAGSLVFMFGRSAVDRLRKGSASKPCLAEQFPMVLACTQVFFGIYGGYFGAANGILMLGMLAAFGISDLSAMNALKSLMTMCLNLIAAGIFIHSGLVQWNHVFWMMIGALVGGACGSHFVTRLNPRVFRSLVSGLGLSLSVYFFFFS